MEKVNIQQVNKFKKVLGIENNIVGIYYLNNLPDKINYHKDTVCTALARSIFRNKILCVNSKKSMQLCNGANYFLKLLKITRNEIIDAYVAQEHIFHKKDVCKKFLYNLPKFPKKIKNKFIVIKPLSKEVDDKPSIIILLTNPAQTGRIIGLLNYDAYKNIKIFPNQPSCISLFAPLVTHSPHLNFIDYYDRYYQGNVNDKKIWPEEKIIISLSYRQFQTIINNLGKSPQGSLNIKMSAHRVDKI